MAKSATEKFQEVSRRAKALKKKDETEPERVSREWGAREDYATRPGAGMKKTGDVKLKVDRPPEVYTPGSFRRSQNELERENRRGPIIEQVGGGYAIMNREDRYKGRPGASMKKTGDVRLPDEKKDERKRRRSPGNGAGSRVIRD